MNNESNNNNNGETSWIFHTPRHIPTALPRTNSLLTNFLDDVASSHEWTKWKYVDDKHGTTDHVTGDELCR